MSEFRRDDVLRILRLRRRELSRWERAGLVEVVERYNFGDLRRLDKLRQLAGRNGVSVSRLRKAVEAMRLADRQQTEESSILTAVAAGGSRRVQFRQSGALLDPTTRQMAFDFELTRAASEDCLRRVQRPAMPQAELQEMFVRAVRLEERPETLLEAKEISQAILEQAPKHATTCINLGTIFYNERKFVEAEALYRRAIEADPGYALAFFDLGNVFEEQMRFREAIEAYGRAVALTPQYADAHYNLALAYERVGEPRKALKHWTAYARLDDAGPWAAHARSQRKRILAGERLAIVARHGRALKIAG